MAVPCMWGPLNVTSAQQRATHFFTYIFLHLGHFLLLHPRALHSARFTANIDLCSCFLSVKIFKPPRPCKVQYNINSATATARKHHLQHQVRYGLFYSTAKEQLSASIDSQSAFRAVSFQPALSERILFAISCYQGLLLPLIPPALQNKHVWGR